MADPIRYFLDQNVHGGTGPGLRARGVDAVSAQDLDRCGLPDPDQLAFATAAGRVLVTHDTDFLVLHAAGVPHAGIAWMPAPRASVGPLIAALAVLHAVYEAHEMVDRVEYL